MSTDNPMFDPEDLLAHTGWLYRLAAQLVDASGSADDLVQDTWVAALRSPPSAERPPRPWLAQVLRNLVKNRRRRAGRWAARARAVAAADDVPLPTAEELLAQHEAQRLLGGLVSELAEPYRSTVLLCYGENLAPGEIARRQGLPAGTVRWRLKRALDQLRERLDARYGNDRRAWCVALAPLAAKALRVGGAAPLVGGMKMVVVVALAAAVAFWLGRAGPDGGSIVSEGASAPSGASLTASAAAERRSRERVAPTVRAGGATPGNPAATPAGAVFSPQPLDAVGRSEGALGRAMEPGSAPQRGPADASVAIVVFGEFQCPFSAAAQATVSELLAAYPREVRLVWRNLPLAFHEHALLAAEAALAAHEQGKFWQMHDRLFQNQNALDLKSLEQHAAALGLDVLRFRNDLVDKRYLQTVHEDMRLARELGITGTPTFLVNGQLLPGARPLALKQAVEEALARARGAPVLATAGSEPPAPAPTLESLLRAADPGTAPSKGDPKAPVTIVMFGNFQCPFCARVQTTLAQLLEAYPTQVRLVWKNRVLPSHEHAALAAEAALAAHEQGKFWPMHDRLLQNQDRLDAAALEGHALALGLDLPRFRQTLAERRFRGTVEEEALRASAAGLDGTPSFLINGRAFKGTRPLADFKGAVEQALGRAPSTTDPAGPSPSPSYATGGRPRFDVGRPLDWPPPRAALPDEVLGEPVRARFPVGDAPTLGPAKAPVEILYLNDYDCDGCGRGKTVVDGLRRAYGDSVRIVARPVPLPDSARASLVAQAAWAAHAQDKFWPMYEKLFSEQVTRDRETLERYALEIGLDLADFRAVLQAGRFRAKVADDLQVVREAGLHARPVYIVNGRRAESTVSLVLLVDAALEKVWLKPPPLPPPPLLGRRGPPGVPRPEWSPLFAYISGPQRFHVETRDEVAAAALEGPLAARIDRDVRAIDPSVSALKVECRSTMCRLRYRPGKQRGSSRAFLRQVYEAESLAVGSEEHAYLRVRDAKETPAATLTRFDSRRSGLLHSLLIGRTKPDPDLPLERLPSER